MFIKLSVFESCIIIGMGMFMHFFGLSIIELRYSKLPLLTPNSASSIFVLSVLGMLTKMRTLWPQTTRMPQRFMVFLVELSLILYATEFILRQMWLPSLKLLNFLCHFLGQYIMTANHNFLIYNAPQLSNFIRNDVFYITRFVLAIAIFVLMLNITGIIKILKDGIVADQNNMKIVDLTMSDDQYNEDYYSGNTPRAQNTNSRNRMPFNVYELPCVPPEDILNLSNRVVTKQKKQKSIRKTKRKNKVLFDDNSMEYNC